MQETTILETIERYIRGEMLPEERVYFEQLRKSNPGVDQMVVEHTIFLNQMNQYGETKELKSRLSEIHEALSATGEIREERPAKVVVLWKKYKRVVWVAASIAGVTALFISSVISYFSPKLNSAQVELLGRRLSVQESRLNKVAIKLDSNNTVIAETSRAIFTTGGTGFLIDARGYLVTNSHVVKGTGRIEVQNSLGEYKARLVYRNDTTDLAVLKIEDSTFKASPIPYGISKTGMELGEEIFTMGYPRNEIVYGKGYMSAKTGYDGDTVTCQITVPANPGNSGAPVLNKDGDVVGIIRSSQHDAQGFVFAIRSKNILHTLNLMRNDSTLSRIHIPLTSAIKGLDREHQVQRIQDCIFIVKQ
ncbi:serine protease [Flavitalea sp. BT771]|uniref:S1C family serine protease n=1 Tax=Flavitalea sp. BT771 TaxID=3063329 RepID=UPI0026E3779D|nr:serine protease [Flavitalea sp. BT771]MDO6432473.1 serine protease [Flavitalea sp. BT771]MDV6221382.1 serine protease [Flavitalea sp. BT771]